MKIFLNRSQITFWKRLKKSDKSNSQIPVDADINIP